MCICNSHLLSSLRNTFEDSLNGKSGHSNNSNYLGIGYSKRNTVSYTDIFQTRTLQLHFQNSCIRMIMKVFPLILSLYGKGKTQLALVFVSITTLNAGHFETPSSKCLKRWTFMQFQLSNTSHMANQTSFSIMCYQKEDPWKLLG